jgi:glycosyltransferase involved in cell wall biosynthesis
LHDNQIVNRKSKIENSYPRMPDMTNPSPPHVLHVVRPAAGGMRRHLELLCAGLSARGFALTIAGPSEFVGEKMGKRGNGEMSRTPSISSFPHFPISITSRPHPINDLRAALAVARYARRADLLHGHGLRGAWIAALAARIARKPFLFTAHNLAPPNPRMFTRRLFGLVTGRAAAVLCISRAVADSLLPYCMDAERIVLIPNGIDLSPFDSLRDRASVLTVLDLAQHLTPSAQRLIVSVGRLAPEKGFDVLAKAAPSVLEACPDACFVLAGEGGERERLAALVRAHGMAERFLMPGHCPDVPGLLSAADVVAVPSRSEGQGLVALEAMAARRPVVASRVGGLTETVADGVNGVLVPPENPAALADALIRLLRDEPARLRMGEEGRARAERDYTADRMADRTAELYRQILGKGVGSRE